MNFLNVTATAHQNIRVETRADEVFWVSANAATVYVDVANESVEFFQAALPEALPAGEFCEDWWPADVFPGAEFGELPVEACERILELAELGEFGELFAVATAG